MKKIHCIIFIDFKAEYPVRNSMARKLIEALDDGYELLDVTSNNTGIAYILSKSIKMEEVDN